MNFISLAIKNVKKNLKNYVMYFISAMFSVMIFYIFCSIAFNDVFVKLADNKAIVKLMFRASAAIVALFSFIFIWYSNSFFLKTRKKEIAIYSIIGMEKKEIARVMLYENAIIGGLAILCGTILGIMFSKYFSLMLIVLMKQAVDFKFSIVPKALGITVLVFIVIFLINSVHSFTIIYKYKLIELLSAHKKGEKAPKASVMMGILSVLLILSGYFMAYNKTTMQLVKLCIPIILLVSAGTYLFFDSLIIILIKAAKRNKSFYYSGENMISTSQILYRIKSNGKTLTIITLLSAATLTSMGATYSFYKTTKESINKDIPFSYEFMNVNSSENEKIKNIISKYADNRLISHNRLKLIDAKMYIPSSENESFKGKVISQSDHNSIITAIKRESIVSLKDNECLLIRANEGDGKKRSYLNKTALIDFKNLKMNFTIIKASDIHIVNASAIRDTIIVSDKAFNDIISKSEENEIANISGYIIQNPEKSKELTEELSKSVPPEKYIDSYYDAYQGFNKGGAIFIFIGMFLGILFSLATCSIMSLKQLMEAADDCERYSILRKIGMNREEIKISIAKQLLINFRMPLMLAICHSTTALIVFQRLVNEKIMKFCTVIMIGYILIYFIYYVITVNLYTNIVCKR